MAERIRDAGRHGGRLARRSGASPASTSCWHGDDLWVNEINTIPGALAWYFWSAEGVSFAALLADMLDEAVTGPVRTRTTEGADGAALRAAGSIAGKLA